MALRFIERNTPLSVMLCDGDHHVIETLDAKFYDMDKQITCLVECDSLRTRSKDLGKGVYLHIEFFRGQRMYAFNAKIVGSSNRDGGDYIVLQQTTEVKETSRRATPRITIAVNTRISLPAEGNPNISGDLLAQGVTLDISADGLGLFSDDVMPKAEPEQRYVTVFELSRAYHFELVARLLRQGHNYKTAQYKYEYGFGFDFNNNPAERERLLTAMLDYRLRLAGGMK